VDDPDIVKAVNNEHEEWITVGRPGYVGGRRGKREKEYQRLFGEGNYRIRHLWHEEVIDRDAALALYEEAYYEFLKANPETLDWLCATASDVYDIAPTNVESGLDYHRQECAAVHLQDIAIRRCLQRLGRAFEGSHLVQIRGHDSEGYRLNPGQVPFHEPSAIIRPSLAQDTWWLEGSIEDMWQSNKILQVRATVPQEVLRDYLCRKLVPNKKKSPAVAMMGGSFNPIHFGHLRIAADLIDLYNFEKVIFVPNGNNYRKKGLIDESHRAAMVKLAIADQPRFELCDFELNRNQVVYTYETSLHLRKKLTEQFGRFQFFNVRGSDIVRRMLNWKSLPQLLECIQIIPVRPGSEPWSLFGDDPRYRLHSDRFRFMERDFDDGLSSSLVRDRIKRTGSARYLVPEAVEAYLVEQGLHAQGP